MARPHPRRSPRPARWVCVALLAAAALAGPARADNDPPAAPDPDHVALFAAGSQRDLWVVVADTQAHRFQLLHRTPRAEPDTLHPVNETPGVPVAIAAAQRTLYLLFADGACQSVRFTWLTEADRPSYDVRQLSPLPDGVQPIDFAATEQGPIVVARDPAAPAPRVLALRGGQWADLTTRPFAPNDRPYVVGGAPAGQGVTFIAERAAGVVVARLTGDDLVARAYPPPAGPIADAIAVAGRPVLALHEPSAHAVELALLHPDGRTLDAGELPLVVSPKRRVALAGRGREAIAVSRNVEGELSIAVRDLNDPADTEAPLRAVTIADWPGASMAHEMIAWGLLLIGIVLVIAVWRRNPVAREVTLPPGVRPAPLTPRTVAALIDAIVPVAAAMVIFDLADPVELYHRWPGVARDWSTVGPGATAIALYALTTTVSELLTRRTLGKAVVRCRVLGADGQPASARAVLVRGALRFVELLLPAFLLFMLLSPAGQRLGDLFARTVVVTGRPTPDGNDGQASGNDAEP